MSIYDTNGLSLPKAYDTNGLQISDAYDVDGLKIWTSQSGRDFYNTAVSTPLPTVNVVGTRQGGCVANGYIFQSTGDSDSGTYMSFIKYQISTGNYTTRRYDGNPNFGHANDMTYCSYDGYLYVCTMRDDGSIIVLDPTDLSYVKTVYARKSDGSAYPVWQFCFDESNNRFYSANRDNFLVYDPDWRYITSIAFPAHPQATGQGCETDGSYLYRITASPNLLDICTVTGEFVKTMALGLSDEPEAIMYDWVTGKYYCSMNINGQTFYRLQLFEE